jgi:uncharacterized oxidoreductase
MRTTGNTILVTGGSSGIGQALAEVFHKLGNQVIISGRRKELLERITAANPGMKSIVQDVRGALQVAQFARQLTAQFPSLNVLINNAGIMQAEDLTAAAIDLSAAEATIETNLLAPIRLTAALLPGLRRQPDSTIINVSSGLAFVPLAMTPTYAASKAALHSYTQSLRFQLRGTRVQVIELIPPAVATDLMPGSRSNPHVMPLDAFITESIALLQATPAAQEICVEQVKRLRFAEASGTFQRMFDFLNPPG